MCNCFNNLCPSSGSCCKPCDPCCKPYGHSSEFGAEVEAIPQITSTPQTTLPPTIRKIKELKRNFPFLLEPQRKASLLKMPQTQITRKVKADVLYSTWQCCKRNGIQDDTPRWYVLGRPFCRPGPSYRYQASYYPSNN